jgi:F-type H+-transporting ATPase subunit delta
VSDQKKKSAAKPKAGPQFTDSVTDGCANNLTTRETEVGRRYAKALFDLSIDNNVLTEVAADLNAVTSWLKESTDFSALMASPIVVPSIKSKALAALADKAEFHQITAKFLGVLARNGRLPIYASIFTSFQVLIDDHNKTVRAHVVTSVPMSAAQAKSLSVALSSALGAEPRVTSEVDPSLLGGIKVKVGSRLFDASLKTQLDSLKFALKRA